METVNVLLVDDQPANLLALEEILRALPFHLDLVRAESGHEALRHLLAHEFAVILLDVLMPVMDGFETATLIRQRERSRHTPIIFLTAIGNSETHISTGYSVGAVDYLFKPVIPDILRAKVAIFVELFQKTEQVKRQAQLLREMEQREHERRVREMEEQWQAERMRLALRIAQDIQANLYPTKPASGPAFDIEGASQPAEGVGGDYFDYFPFPDGTLAIAIGDVTGHGVGPALLMAATRAYVRALALSHSDLGEILMLANRALAADITDGRFVTLLLARLDPADRSLVFAGAGHPPGYILTRDGSIKTKMESDHLPLGVLEYQSFSASTAITLDPGDVIVMLTDGVAEAKNRAGALFGEQRAIDFIRGCVHQSARHIVAALGEQVRRYSDRSSPEDDVTALIVKVKADSPCVP